MTTPSLDEITARGWLLAHGIATNPERVSGLAHLIERSRKHGSDSARNEAVAVARKFAAGADPDDWISGAEAANEIADAIDRTYHVTGSGAVTTPPERTD